MYGSVRGVPGNRHSYRDFYVDNLWKISHLNHMPRRARIDATGAMHHIVIRGIESKAIFKDDTDWEDFIERLSSLLQEMVCGCNRPVSICPRSLPLRAVILAPKRRNWPAGLMQTIRLSARRPKG